MSSRLKPQPPSLTQGPSRLPRTSHAPANGERLHISHPMSSTTLGGLSFCLFIGARRQSSAVVLAFSPIR